jgi:cytochrome P450
MRFFGEGLTEATTIVSAPAEEHSHQRRLFSHAFSNTALKAQEDLLAKYSDQMIDRMGEMQVRDGKVNIVDYLNFATFDIMAELSFGESLKLLERGDYVPWVHMIFDGLKGSVMRIVFLEIPILGPLLNAISISTLRKKSKEHMQFAAELVDRRLNQANFDKPDIWSFVLRHNEDGKGLTLPQMHANSAVFMVAGSETTATTLSGTFYYLLRTPHAYEKLRQEVRQSFSRSEDIKIAPLARMEYLTAVLQEGLRLYHPGGAGMCRIVPAEGGNVCGHFVPPGVRYRAKRSPICGF